IYEEIDHLERSDVETAKLTGGREIMYALAMLAMLVLIGEAVLSETWLRRLPCSAGFPACYAPIHRGILPEPAEKTKNAPTNRGIAALKGRAT
ncbi:MAG TPA: hypothetical protein VKE70_12990, partial [Candidatus Solibacter sp.]|nr:hypothetical protein [Candidatus Solibacter sp.]